MIFEGVDGAVGATGLEDGEDGNVKLRAAGEEQAHDRAPAHTADVDEVARELQGGWAPGAKGTGVRIGTSWRRGAKIELEGWKDKGGAAGCAAAATLGSLGLPAQTGRRCN